MGEPVSILAQASSRAVLVLVILFAGLYAYAWRNPLGADAHLIDPGRFRAVEVERLKAGLPDPARVRVRDEFVAGSKPWIVVCGEVNARDDRGNLTGFRRFIAGPSFKAMGGDVEDGVMDALWSAMCVRKR